MTPGQTSQWILHRLHSCLLWWTTTRGLPLCSYVSWKWALICYSVSSLRNCPEFFWAFVLVEREKKINLLLMATTTNSQTDHSLNVFPEELSTILLSFYSGRFFVICYFGPPQPTHKSNIHSAMSSSSNQIFIQRWVPHLPPNSQSQFRKPPINSTTENTLPSGANRRHSAACVHHSSWHQQLETSYDESLWHTFASLTKHHSILHQYIRRSHVPNMKHNS